MNILAVDTSGPVAGVALTADGKVVYEASADAGRTHSETLMPMLDACLASARLEPKDIGLFACVAGPGSFTGVRIGACAVRALSHATGAPCARIDALEALACGLFGCEGAVCPILDARRGQVYCAAFSWNQGALPVRLREDAALPLEAFLDGLPRDGKLWFTGDGVAVHGEAIVARLGERAHLAPPHLNYLRPSAACYLALNRPEAACGHRELLPIYLRAPQAERERAERLKEAGDAPCRS